MSPSDNRSVRQIEEDIAASRDQLATTIDTLVHRANPSTIVERQKNAATVMAKDALYTPNGELRIERVAIAGGTVLLLLGLSILRRSR